VKRAIHLLVGLLAALCWPASSAQGIEPLDNPVATVIDNQDLGNVTFPIPGDWELTMTLRISEIDQATVTTTVPVK
jgi:copper transport protein